MPPTSSRGRGRIAPAATEKSSTGTTERSASESSCSFKRRVTRPTFSPCETCAAYRRDPAPENPSARSFATSSSPPSRTATLDAKGPEVTQELRQRRVAYDLAFGELDDPADDLPNLLDTVRAQHHDPRRRPLLELLEEGCASGPVEVRRRLVAHEDRRLGRERHRREELLLHPPRQVAEPFAGDDAHGQTEALGALANGLDGPATQGGTRLHDLGHGGVDRRSDLRNVGHAAHRDLGLTGDVTARDGDLALDLDEAEHGPQERRLPRPVGPDEGDTLPLLDTEGHPVERRHGVERFSHLRDGDHGVSSASGAILGDRSTNRR
jgi:hypothetical protein